MNATLQTKLLIAILAVLGVIAGVAVRSERPAVMLSKDDLAVQKTFEAKTLPSNKPYLIP